MLLDYIPGVDSDSQKEEYARQLYEENIDNESTFLYVYFAKENESESDDPGYMCYVNGIQVSSVMDAEALDIFWAYLDKYWYTDRGNEPDHSEMQDERTSYSDIRYLCNYLFVHLPSH